MTDFSLLTDYIYMALYGASFSLSTVACLYLLLRRGNAFARVESPLSVRRWTAAFLAAMALSHVWWITLGLVWFKDDPLARYAMTCGLDSVTLVPLAMVTILRMLQDRRRPLWPVWLSMVPVVVICFGVGVIARRELFELLLFNYLTFLGIVFTVHVLIALRRYGRWLRDNYADLEHKEVRQSLFVLSVILLMFYIYSLSEYDHVAEYSVQVLSILFIFFLVWRVELLQTLEEVDVQAEGWSSAGADRMGAGGSEGALDDCEQDGFLLDDLSEKINGKDGDMSPRDLPALAPIGTLLENHCEIPQLYLQHDLTLAKLSAAIGTNRTYLSAYFRQNGETYNAYINGLRIEHFIRLCHEALTAHQPFFVQEAAQQSGFLSYRTFTATFKKFTDMTASKWIEREKRKAEAN